MASYLPLVDEEANYNYDDKGGAAYAFAERTVRQGFVRKVFGILAVQLAITAAIVTAFVTSEPVRGFVASNPWTLWTSLIVSFALVLTLSCSEQARRQHPLNILMLMAFTLCESVLLGAASATYDTRVVMLAVGITAGVVMALSLFAVQTKFDLTASGGALLSLLFTLVIASILQAFLHVAWLELLLSAGGALLFSVYLVFDIQLLLGSPHHAAALSPDEYVYGALAIYMDVLNLFLYILRLVNDLSNQNS